MCDRARAKSPLGVNYFTPLIRAQVHVSARMKHSPIFGTRYPGAGRFFAVRRSRATTAAASNLLPNPVHAICSCQGSVTAAVFMSYGMDLPRKISESHRIRGPHSSMADLTSRPMSKYKLVINLATRGAPSDHPADEVAE
jgi:hypothetical protein